MLKVSTQSWAQTWLCIILLKLTWCLEYFFLTQSVIPLTAINWWHNIITCTVFISRPVLCCKAYSWSSCSGRRNFKVEMNSSQLCFLMVKPFDECMLKLYRFILLIPFVYMTDCHRVIQCLQVGLQPVDMNIRSNQIQPYFVCFHLES